VKAVSYAGVRKMSVSDHPKPNMADRGRAGVDGQSGPGAMLDHQLTGPIRRLDVRCPQWL
jgi:hypothetical protein